jgi:hypothetical protein
MQQFDDIFSRSTAAIDAAYFRPPNCGTNWAHSEKVYLYELYHQLRLHWPPPNSCPYRLNIGSHQDDERLWKVADLSSPYLFVHAPGFPNYYAVIAVHQSRIQTSDARKHLRALAQFASLGYRRAIYLVYGVEAVLNPIQQFANDSTTPIEIWFHSHVSTSAARVFVLTPGR